MGKILILLNKDVVSLHDWYWQYPSRLGLKAGAVFFTAGCNVQVFSPKPKKNFAQICAVVYEKNAKTA